MVLGFEAEQLKELSCHSFPERRRKDFRNGKIKSSVLDVLNLRYLSHFQGDSWRHHFEFRGEEWAGDTKFGSHQHINGITVRFFRKHILRPTSVFLGYLIENEGPYDQHLRKARRGSRMGQRQLSYSAGLTASADSIGSSGAETACESCPMWGWNEKSSCLN